MLLEAAGAMRRGDPRLTEFVEARRRRDQERQRAAMRSEAESRLATSPESLAWSQVWPHKDLKLFAV